MFRNINIFFVLVENVLYNPMKRVQEAICIHIYDIFVGQLLLNSNKICMYSTELNWSTCTLIVLYTLTRACFVLSRSIELEPLCTDPGLGLPEWTSSVLFKFGLVWWGLVYLLIASVSLLVPSSPESAADRLEAPKLERRRARNRFKT